MNQREQSEFIEQLSSNIAREIVGLIQSGRIPENWDGIELRWLLAERHKLSASMGNDNKRRKRNFNNTVLVSNL